MKKKLKININNFLFFSVHVLNTFASIFPTVSINEKILTMNYFLTIIMSIILFVYQNLYLEKKIETKKLILLVILFIISIISSIYTNSTILLRTFLVIFTFRNIKLHKYIKFDLFIRSTFVLILVVLFYFGLTEPLTFFRGESIRYAFGFCHPNQFGLQIMIICMDLFYLYKINCVNKKYKRQLIILISLLNFIVYYFANSRASFLVILILLIFIVFENIKIKQIFENKIIKFIIKNCFVIFLLLTFSLTLLYRNQNILAEKINVLTSSRLFWAEEYLNNYNVNLFGNELLILEEKQLIDGNYYFVLDNAYMFFILNHGMIICILFIFMFNKTFEKLYKNKQYQLIAILFIFSIYGLMENSFVKFNFNPYLVLLCFSLFENKKLFEPN